jgi:hypothetical protein
MCREKKGAIHPMIYYRIAFQREPSSSWQWRSSTMTSIASVHEVLKTYPAALATALRIFFSSSPVRLDQMLARANDGFTSNSLTVEQFLRGGLMSAAEIQRWEFELCSEGDHDCPYIFTLPATQQQAHVWTKLLAKVQNGEWQP